VPTPPSSIIATVNALFVAITYRVRSPGSPS
jgi:hypothetical protein